MPVRRRTRRPASLGRRSYQAPRQRPLLSGADHGSPISIPADEFVPRQQTPGWGPFAEAFLRANEEAFRALELRPELGAGTKGMVIRLHPGGRTGAAPLRSAQTGHVVGGVVIRPRFGWSGVGRVLSEVGWHASPQFIDLPLVPGSGREVPPWVLAGPVIARLADLLAHVRRGYRQTQETLQKPRGKILWAEYLAGPMRTGKWHHLPCRFPELSNDPNLRSLVRWCLEHIRRALTGLEAGIPMP